MTTRNTRQRKIAFDHSLLGSGCFARACISGRIEGSIMCAPHWSRVSPAVKRKLIRAIGAYRNEESIATLRELEDAALAANVCVALSDEARAEMERDARRDANA